VNSSLLERLSTLDRTLSRSALPRAQRAWGGARTVVSNCAPSPRREQAFYPDPRYVVSEHYLELSWLVEQLREAFMGYELIDASTKFEFFGRLCNAANLCIQENPRVTAHVLCAAVLHEAYAIAVDIDSGEFHRSLEFFMGDVADDDVEPTFRSGFIGIEATLDFFRARGIVVFGTA